MQSNLDAINEAGARARRTKENVADLPRLYRNACHHLALARGRAYSPRLIERLSRVVLRGHQVMYSKRPNVLRAVMSFITLEYPRLFREQWRYMLAAGILFFGTFFTMLIVVQMFPHMVYTVLDPWQVKSMEVMYKPEVNERLGPSRDSDSDFQMFGFYIKNNTGIGFQTFAGGLVFGIGTLFFLVYNGLVVGAAAGHLTGLGYIETFWGFVAGHSAPELTAIMLSGAAGLKLGWALIAPGQKTRLRALRDAATTGVRIIYGAALLFLLAAFIEAFWSSMSSIPVQAKYTTGIVFWFGLWYYLLMVGRSQRAV
ncbi:MAG: stage II sporulation protein M [Gammaproteobacteria bacterium]|nr:MAG: stage II sporulation protein M [Gammaproteobacteria bacterium]